MFIFCYYLCRLFLFDIAKLRCFSSDSKKNRGFFSNLYGQTPCFWTNRGNQTKKLSERLLVAPNFDKVAGLKSAAFAAYL
jgi:hypothetical protein